MEIQPSVDSTSSPVRVSHTTSNGTVKAALTPSRADLLSLLSKLQKKLQATENLKNEYKHKFEQLSAQAAEHAKPSTHSAEDGAASVPSSVVRIEVDVRNTSAEQQTHTNGAHMPADSALTELSAQLQSQSERCVELEQRNAVTEQRLKQAFELLKQSKQQSAELEQQLAAANNTAEKQIQQLRSSHGSEIQQLQQQHQRAVDESKHQLADVQRAAQRQQAEHMQQMQEAQQQVQQLQEQLSALQQERTQYAQSKKLLEQRSVQISELIDTIDRERAVRDSEKLQRDNDIDVLTQECERMRQEMQRQLLQAQNERSDALSQLQAQLTHTATQLHQAQTQAAEQADALTAEQQRNAELQVTVQQLQSEVSALQHRMSDVQQTRDRELRTIEFRHIDKYERSQRENQQQIQQLNSELQHRQSMIQQLQQRCSELQHEMETGKPGERKLYELAHLQARRDESLHQLQSENRELKALCTELENKLQRYKTERQFLHQQVQQHTRSQSISQINIDYLRSIIVRYMQFQNNVEQRDQLTTVIARLLQFSNEDMQTINRARAQSSNTSFFSALFTAATATDSAATSPYKLSQSNPSVRPSVDLHHDTDTFTGDHTPMYHPTPIGGDAHERALSLNGVHPAAQHNTAKH